METAPESRQQPVMPDPDRVVTRSIAMLTRMGYGHQNAAVGVAYIAREAIRVLALAAIDDVGWLEAIAAEAETRAGSIAKSPNDQQEMNHADGTGSGAGGPAAIGPPTAQR